MKNIVKKYGKAVISVFTCLVIAFSCTCNVFAAEEIEINDIHIDDYVSDKYYDGDDVIVTYDLPLAPYAEISGNNTVSGYEGSWTFSGDGNSFDLNLTQMSDYIDVGTYTEVVELGYFAVAGSTSTNLSEEFASSYGSFYAPISSAGIFKLLLAEWDTFTDVYPYLRLQGAYYPLTGTAEGTFPTDGVTPYKAFQYGDYWLIVSEAGCCFCASRRTAGSWGLGEYTVESVFVNNYDSIAASFHPLGYDYTDKPVYNVVDISDFRNGATFTVQFEYSWHLLLDGNIGTTETSFIVRFLTKDLESLDEFEYEFVIGSANSESSKTLSFDVTIPEDAAYFYIFYGTGNIPVENCRTMSWSFYDFKMISTLSAIQDNTKTMEKVVEGLDKIYSGSLEDQEKADEFNEVIESVKPELDQNIGELNNVQKPDISEVKTNPVDMVDQAGIDNATMLLGALVAYPLCGLQLVGVIGLMLVAYILHGKKG